MTSAFIMSFPETPKVCSSPLITLLGYDAIPAIQFPEFLDSEEAQLQFDADEQVLGLSINGDNRAYSIPMLSRHEIVNDVLGGRPILVTFCPLTGSGIVYDPVMPDIDAAPLNFGVSGLLFDNNLILFDRRTDSLWSQMRLESICGALSGTTLSVDKVALGRVLKHEPGLQPVHAFCERPCAGFGGMCRA